jgi:hypothetical protein
VERAICQCVHDLLPTINENYAALLRRVDLDGASIADVAAETGMSPNNVRLTLHRARSCGSTLWPIGAGPGRGAGQGYHRLCWAHAKNLLYRNSRRLRLPVERIPRWNGHEHALRIVHGMRASLSVR